MPCYAKTLPQRARGTLPVVVTCALVRVRRGHTTEGRLGEEKSEVGEDERDRLPNITDPQQQRPTFLLEWDKLNHFNFVFLFFFPNSLWCLYTDNTWRTLFYKYSFKHSPHVSHPSPPLQHNIIVSYESNPITQSVDMQLPTGYKKRLMQWSIVNRWRCWGYGSLNMQQGKPRLSRGAVHLPQSPVVWGHQVVGKKITNQCIFLMWLLLN